MNALVLPFRAPQRPHHQTLEDLAGHLAEVESRQNPDLDVEVRTLRMTPSGMIVIPNLGEMVLTDWSKSQLGKNLGVSWDRWFLGANPDERADEINRRLARASGTLRMRTTKKVVDGIDAKGTIRAVLTREYTPVADTMIVDLVREALVGVEDDAQVVRSYVTDMATGFVIKVGKPYHPGGPGNVGEMWGGIHVRNSGVGYARLSVTLHLIRLVCRNGMTAPLPDADLIRTRHRWIDVTEIRTSLRRGLEGIGDRLHRGVNVMAAAAHDEVRDVEGEVRGLLRDAVLPVRLLGEIMRAYDREPHLSRFGISQAVTLAAQDQDAEVRYELERAAGRYLARA